MLVGIVEDRAAVSDAGRGKFARHTQRSLDIAGAAGRRVTGFEMGIGYSIGVIRHHVSS